MAINLIDKPTLYDLRNTFNELRRDLVEHLGGAAWYSALSFIINLALDHYFHGSVLAGEREVEKRLIKYGIPFEDAVKISRRLYDNIGHELSVKGGLDVCRVDCEYRYWSEHMLLLVTPLVPRATCKGRRIDRMSPEQLVDVARRLHHGERLDQELVDEYEKNMRFH